MLRSRGGSSSVG